MALTSQTTAPKVHATNLACPTMSGIGCIGGQAELRRP